VSLVVCRAVEYGMNVMVATQSAPFCASPTIHDDNKRSYLHKIYNHMHKESMLWPAACDTASDCIEASAWGDSNLLVGFLVWKVHGYWKTCDQTIAFQETRIIMQRQEQIAVRRQNTAGLLLMVAARR
jgi:hypothetical protein